MSIRNSFARALLGFGLAIISISAQAGVLVTPTSVEHRFILTDESVSLPTDLAGQIGYPVWQKVGMNGTASAVPSYWCLPLLQAKPWLVDVFGNTWLNAQEECWLNVSLVTAELENIAVPSSSQRKWTPWWDDFWRNRPNGFEYWVPAFSVSEAEFLTFIGEKVPTTDTFDPAVLVERIQAFEKRLSDVEKGLEDLTQQVIDQPAVVTKIEVEDIAKTAAKAAVGAIELPTGLTAEEKTAIAAEAAGLVQVPDVVVSGLPVPFTDKTVPWWMLWLAFGVVFGLMLIGIVNRSRSEDQQKQLEPNSKLATVETDTKNVVKRVEHLEEQSQAQTKTLDSLQDEVEMLKETSHYLVERDIAGRIVVDGFTYEVLNSLEPGESLPDFKMAALHGGNPIGAWHVRLTREVDSTGKPLLRIVGAFKPGEDTIPAKKNRQEDWHFTVPQILTKLNTALEKGEVHGLGKAKAKAAK